MVSGSVDVLSLVLTNSQDQYNFETLNGLANTLDLTLIQFVTAIQANDWKIRYHKTFVIAAFVNGQAA